MTQAQIDRYINTDAAASILNLTRQRVNQLAAAGRLPHLNTALGRLFPRQELEQLAKTRKKKDSGRRKAPA